MGKQIMANLTNPAFLIAAALVAMAVVALLERQAKVRSLVAGNNKNL